MNIQINYSDAQDEIVRLDKIIGQRVQHISHRLCIARSIEADKAKVKELQNEIDRVTLREETSIEEMRLVDCYIELCDRSRFQLEETQDRINSMTERLSILNTYKSKVESIQSKLSPGDSLAKKLAVIQLDSSKSKLLEQLILDNGL